MIRLGICRGFLLSFMAFPTIILKKLMETNWKPSKYRLYMLLKIGDLNELSRLDEKLSGKLSENKLTSTRYNNLIRSSTKII